MAFDEVGDSHFSDYLSATDFHPLWVRICWDKSNILNPWDGRSRDYLLPRSSVLPKKVVQTSLKQIEMGESNEQTSDRSTADIFVDDLLLFIACICQENNRRTALRWLHRHTYAEWLFFSDHSFRGNGSIHNKTHYWTANKLSIKLDRASQKTTLGKSKVQLVVSFDMILIWGLGWQWWLFLCARVIF